jgi:hypothetical protein
MYLPASPSALARHHPSTSSSSSSKSVRWRTVCVILRMGSYGLWARHDRQSTVQANQNIIAACIKAKREAEQKDRRKQRQRTVCLRFISIIRERRQGDDSFDSFWEAKDLEATVEHTYSSSLPVEFTAAIYRWSRGVLLSRTSELGPNLHWYPWLDDNVKTCIMMSPIS